ncbi:uncharacterized protein LOC115775679 isoform X1 [Archocentrus centrarchus]|uniref:uncharacterized protein LOC115775679 isoform X1 n=1 Tax=Archocentrus centrarchus TaxID=63155 RepID=UPI0011EA2866|nr:uncharacterized protein LOC115775679 isoform X1 [Archocentrus centrarchus]
MQMNYLIIIRCDFLDLYFRFCLSQLKGAYDKSCRPLHPLGKLIFPTVVSHYTLLVEVYEGAESAVLPCQVPVSFSTDSSAAEWERDEFKVPTVHVRLQSGDELDQQNNRYINRTSMRADALQTGDLSLTLRNPTHSDSGTYTCTTRRVGQVQSRKNIQLMVRAPSRHHHPPCVSVLRLFCHLVVFCPYCISTGLLLSICCSRRTPNRPDISMEMTQRDGGGQGLEEDYDDIIANVTTEHAF